MKKRICIFAALFLVILCAACGAADRETVTVTEPAPIAVPEPQPEAASQDGPGVIFPGEQNVVPLDQLEIVEASGNLEGLTETALTLVVSGKTYLCTLFSECVFVGQDGAKVDRETFGRQYMKRFVTVELEKKTGTVMACRVH